MPSSGPVLVANGPVQWTEELAAMAAAADPLLAADGGANHLARIGLGPQWVIGDLDSISDGTRAWIGEERMVHLPDQDFSDLEKAVAYCLDELGLDRLTVLGATGGRVDHAVVNLGLLARRALGEDLVYLGVDHRIVAVAGEIVLESTPGETWSFWTFDPGVRVTLQGVRWPLDNTALDLAGRPSMSNEAVGDTVTVRADGGAVVVMRYRGS